MPPRPAPRLPGLFAALAMMLVVGVMAAGAGTAVQAQTAAQAPAPVPVIYTIEQLRTGPLAKTITDQMIPLQTLAAVETLLKTNRISFAWTIADIGADKLPPDMAKQIAALPPREVFVVSGNGGVLIGVVIGQR
jgi:hypothetical protein